MNENIIRMAREAGFHIHTDPIVGDMWLSQHHENNFQRFAALVAAAEREACAKVADAWDHDKRIAAAIRARSEK